MLGTVLRIVANAAGMLLWWPSAAHADPVSAAIAGVFTAVGVPAAAATLLGTVSSLAIGIGLNYAAQALLGNRQRGSSAQPFSVQVQVQAGGVVPRSFLFGEEACTAGSLIYHGATAAGGNTPNAYYVAEFALSDLPIAALTGIIVDGATVTWNSGDTPASFGIAIPEYNKDGVDHLWVTFSDGTQTAADSFMSTWFGSDSDYPYTSTMIGRGIAKVRIVALVNRDLFPSGAPKFRFICQGIPLYDLRNDTSAGGAGSEDWDDGTTWSLKGDPATLAYNIARGIYYDGEWFYGGQNLAASRLPYASWAAAANECDADIDLVGGGSEKQFRVSGEIQVSTEPATALEALLKCCNGRMAEIGGAYKIVVGGPGAAVLSLTDDDVVVTEPQKFDPFPNLDGTINGITAQYPDPDEGFELKDAPPLYSADYEAADGDRRLVSQVRYDFATSNTQVQRLMKAALQEARRFRRHNHVMPPSAYELEPLDVVSWTSERNSYANKLFRIDGAQDGDNCDQAWAITEVDPTDFDWDETEDEQTVSAGSLVVQRPAAQAIVDWAVSGVTVQGDGGRARPGLRLAWNTAVVDVDGVQFQVRLSSDATLVLAGETDGWDLGALDVTQNLVSNTDYEARGRYRPISGRDTSWSSWLAATTPDVRFDLSELSATLDPLLDQLRVSAGASLAARLDELSGQIEALAQQNNGAYAIIDAQINRIVSTVGKRVGNNEATVTTLSEAQATDRDAIAQFLVDLFASTGSGTAEVLLRFIAASLPDGAVAAADLELRAGSGLEWATAALSLAVYYSVSLGYYSRVQVKADQFDFVDSDGTVSPLGFAVIALAKTTPIEDGQITVDLRLRRGMYVTYVDDDAEIQFPLGAEIGFKWSHLFIGQGISASVTIDFTSYMLDEIPEISTLNNVYSLYEGTIVSVTPPVADFSLKRIGSTATAGNRRFTVVPAIDGRSVWDLDLHGPLTITEAGTYEITPTGDYLQFTMELWGPGGSTGGFGSTYTDGGAGEDSTFSGLTAGAGGRALGSDGSGAENGTGGTAGGASGGDTNTSGNAAGNGSAPPVLSGSGAAAPDGGAAVSGVGVPSYGSKMDATDGNDPGGGANGLATLGTSASAVRYFAAGGGGSGAKVTKAYGESELLGGVTYPLVVGDSGDAGTGSGNVPYGPYGDYIPAAQGAKGGVGKAVLT